MLTPEAALNWELRRLLRRRLVIVFLAMSFFPLLCALPIVAYRVSGAMRPGTEAEFPPWLHLGLNTLAMGVCLFGVGEAIGMSTRQYALPIGARQLAGTRIFSGALCCTILALVMNMMMALLLRDEWPVLGPALSYGVGFMLAYSMMYRFRGNEFRLGIMVLCVLTILLYWNGIHYGPRWWYQMDHGWSELTLTELVVLAFVAYTAWRNLVAAVELDRRGMGWGRKVLVETPTVAPANTLRARPRRFLNRYTAQFWLEWRQDGWLIPLVAVAFLFMIALIHLTTMLIYGPQRQDEVNTEVAASITFMAFLPICACHAWFVGLSGTHGKRAAFQRTWSTSQTTLPLSDAALGWIYFWRVIASALVAGLGVLAVGGLWLGAIELIARSLNIRHSLPPVQFSFASAAGYTGALLLTLWLTTTFSCAATLTGRRWIAGLPLSMTFGTLLFAVLSSLALPNNTGSGMGEILVVAFLGIPLVGSLLAYVVGIFQNKLGVLALVSGFALFIISEFVGLTVLRMQFEASHMPYQQADLYHPIPLFLLALPAATPALIPLATSLNRHR